MWKTVRTTAIELVVVAAFSVTTAAAREQQPESAYLDDRSTPEAVIMSYYDAVNKREFARAYSYWEPEAAQRELPSFDEFVQGYGETTSVEVTLGVASSDVGAGQLYYTVPIRAVAWTSDGSVQTFVGCYALHLARPQLQAVPPFRPMGIQHADIDLVDDGEPNLAAMSC